MASGIPFRHYSRRVGFKIKWEFRIRITGIHVAKPVFLHIADRMWKRVTRPRVRIGRTRR